MKICIVRLSALGDVLMIIPLLRTLQHNFPHAKITWIISPLAYELVSNMKEIEFIVLPKPKGVKDIYNFYKLMENRMFDVLIAAQASFRANILYPFIHARRKIGYDKLRAKDGHRWFVNETIEPGCDHTLEGFLKFAQPLGVMDYKISWNIPINTEDNDWASEQIPKDKFVIIINPAASKPERSWVKERYVEVIKAMQEQYDAFIILTGGPAAHDAQLGEYITKHAEVKNLIGKTKPKQLLALIAKANLVLCPDTGPSHMAAAMNTPVVALHAVTSSDVSGPYTFRHLAIDSYLRASRKYFGTRKEKLPWGAHIHGKKTMNVISSEVVIDHLSNIINVLKGKYAGIIHNKAR